MHQGFIKQNRNPRHNYLDLGKKVCYIVREHDPCSYKWMWYSQTDGFLDFLTDHWYSNGHKSCAPIR